MDIVVNIQKHNGLNVVSSRVVAEQLGKEHKNVLRDLEKILSSSKVSHLIIESSYKAKTGSYKEFLLSKDGFTMYMFNIQGYNEFKMAYINKFNEMEKMLNDPMAIYEGKSRWDLILLHAQAEKDKEIMALEHKQEVKAIVDKLENTSADLRTNFTQAVTRLASLYIKHNTLVGLEAERVRREIYQTIYSGFCSEWNVDFNEIKDMRFVSLKTGKPTKTKQSFVAIFEHKQLLGSLLQYTNELRIEDIKL